MAESIVQADFGGFNPRFPGVTVKVGSEAALRAFHEYVRAPAGRVPAGDSLEEIALLSVLDHEVRHYHDALLSPYANTVFRLRLQSVISGVQAMVIAREVDGELLPVPLARWITTPADARVACVEEWQALLAARSSAVALPVRTLEELLAAAEPGVLSIADAAVADGFQAAAENAVRAYLRIDQVTAGFLRQYVDDPPWPELQPFLLYEVLALCVQLHAIWIGQGEAQAVAFARHLMRSPLPYALLWRRVHAVADRVTPAVESHASGILRLLLVTRQMMAMAQWAVMGFYQTDGAAACPAVRLMALVSHLLADGDARHDFAYDIGATWDHWDAQVGRITPWRDALQEMLAQADRAVQRYGRIKELWHAGPVMPEFVNDILARHVAAQKTVVGHVLKDPETFVNPAAYVQLPYGTLPVPVVRLEVTGGYIPLSDFEGSAYVPSTTITSDGVAYANRWIVRAPDPDFDARRLAAESFERVTQLCDMAFSWHPVPDDLHRTMQHELERHCGKRVVHLV